MNTTTAPRHAYLAPLLIIGATVAYLALMLYLTDGSGTATVLLTALLVAYWFPTVLALVRHTHNAGGVAVMNLLFGWTIVGWFGALFMAAGSHSKP